MYLLIDRARTNEKRLRILSDLSDYIANHPGQTIFDAAEVLALQTHKNEYVILYNHHTDTQYAQGVKIREANVAIGFLRMADTQCQQVVKFKIEAEKPGWDGNIYTLYDMAPGHPLVSRTTTVALLKSVSEKIIAGEHTRVVVNGGTALDWAVDVASQYNVLVAPGGKLVLRSNAITANNAAIIALDAKNVIVDPFIAKYQDKIEASGGGMTKAQVRAIGILWGIQYMSIGDESIINILVKDRETMEIIVGAICHADKYDPLDPPSENPVAGAAGITGVFGTTIIKTLRVGGIEIIVELPDYIKSITHETILEGSTNNYIILLDRVPPVILP